MHNFNEPGEGEKFGKWIVVGAVFRQTKKIDGAVEWFVPCRCECGTYRAVRVAQLRSGHSSSCGECVGVNADSKRLYNIWRGMLARCYRNDWDTSYADYGGRGITVCDEWRDNFKAFRQWALSHGYANKLQCDRINNDLGYSPDNCRWVTNDVNQRNRRGLHLITAFGETRCLMDWVKDSRCTVSFSGLKTRLKMGMSPEEAITAPSQRPEDRRWLSKQITALGETKSVAAWERDLRCPVSRRCITRRLSEGWDQAAAVLTPATKGKRKIVTLDLT